MHRPSTLRRAAAATTLAALMGAAALPVGAVNIPDGAAINPDSTSVIHFRVTSACDGLPMDTLEVTLPASVKNPIPEAVPGWEVVVDDPAATDEEDMEAEDAEADEAEADDAEADENAEPVVVRWSGGPLPDGRLLDFGMRARFADADPDADGEVLEFPVVQRCGEIEVEHTPTAMLSQRYDQAAIAQIDAEVDSLRKDVNQLRTDVDQLQEQVGDVNVVNLRTRVRDNENAIEDLDGRVSTLEEEPAPEEG